MSARMKPCPFCGGEATGVHMSGDAWFTDVEHAPDCHFADFQRTEADAVAAWNRRSLCPETLEAAANLLEDDSQWTFAGPPEAMAAFEDVRELAATTLRAMKEAGE